MSTPANSILAHIGNTGAALSLVHLGDRVYVRVVGDGIDYTPVFAAPTHDGMWDMTHRLDDILDREGWNQATIDTVARALEHLWNALTVLAPTPVAAR